MHSSARSSLRSCLVQTVLGSWAAMGEIQLIYWKCKVQIIESLFGPRANYSSTLHWQTATVTFMPHWFPFPVVILGTTLFRQLKLLHCRNIINRKIDMYLVNYMMVFVSAVVIQQLLMGWTCLDGKRNKTSCCLETFILLALIQIIISLDHLHFKFCFSLCNMLCTWWIRPNCYLVINNNKLLSAHHKKKSMLCLFIVINSQMESGLH